MFELIDVIKDLTTAARDRNWTVIVEKSGKVLDLIAQVLKTWNSSDRIVALASGDVAAKLDQALSELVDAERDASTMTAANAAYPMAINPVLVVELIGMIVRLVREIRNG